MIRELHNQLVSGKKTSVKLTEEYLAVIKEKDSALNAFLTLTEDLALEQAQEVDQKIAKGESIISKVEIIEDFVEEFINNF